MVRLSKPLISEQRVRKRSWPVHRVASAAGVHGSVTIKAGDSLASAIIRGGVPRQQAYANLGKLKAIDARRLQPGDKLALTLIGDAAHRRLASITWTPRRGSAVTVALLPGGAANGTAVAGAAVGQSDNAAMIVKTMLVHGSAGLPRTLTESGLCTRRLRTGHHGTLACGIRRCMAKR